MHIVAVHLNRDKCQVFHGCGRPSLLDDQLSVGPPGHGVIISSTSRSLSLRGGAAAAAAVVGGCG